MRCELQRKWLVHNSLDLYQSLSDFHPTLRTVNLALIHGIRVNEVVSRLTLIQTNETTTRLGACDCLTSQPDVDTASSNIFLIQNLMICS